MTKRSRNSPEVQAYLRALGNPYASSQMFDDADVEDEKLIQEQHLYRLRGNPYAKLVADEEKHPGTALSRVIPPSTANPIEALSKSEFRARARRLFRQYVPALEKGRLRPHHQDFITRNELCLPAKRYRLIKHLAKYDISKIQGIIPQFNRERDALTDEKLKEIERLADGGE